MTSPGAAASPSFSASSRPVVAVGEFDGFHLGHRQLVHAALQLAARDGRPVVAVILDDELKTDVLSSVADRCQGALRAGAHAVHVVALRSNDAGVAERVLDDIVERINPCAAVMACLPFAGGAARYPSLRTEIARRRLELIQVDRWQDAGRQPITTDRVAQAIRTGDVARAMDWLGAPYTVSGEVVHGSALGRTIGFPTANVVPPAGLVIPGRGVYAATVTMRDGSVQPAAVNIGVRPTVEDEGVLLIEAHLVGFDGDLYGSVIRIAFRHWLRGEMRFESLDALVAQLKLDTARARIALGR